MSGKHAHSQPAPPEGEVQRVWVEISPDAERILLHVDGRVFAFPQSPDDPYLRVDRDLLYGLIAASYYTIRLLDDPRARQDALEEQLSPWPPLDS